MAKENELQVLRRVRPTPEQISIVRRIQTGPSLIRGAAGSGKTTTALLALRASTGATVNQLRNQEALPANILVLTYYNSLCGYVRAVVQEEMEDYADDIRIFTSTFDKWAQDTLELRGGRSYDLCKSKLQSLAQKFQGDVQFVIDEVNYLRGRFKPDRLQDYITAERTGRGTTPAMPRALRQRLLDEVVQPYLDWKEANSHRDFHDNAIEMMHVCADFKYDVIVVDEAQDLSLNQLRAVTNHAADDATIIFVTDTAQRIYPRGGTWLEAGIVISPGRSLRLNVNYRNTRQIASLAACIAQGLGVDDDGSLPNPALCSRDGDLPTVIYGRFPDQVEYAMRLLQNVDLENETVGFLHLKGGGYFRDIRSALTAEGLEFCELQGASVWPEDDSNIGLCTFHSAKGLEFDHVFMLGLDQEFARYGDGDDDDRYNSHRRLVAMGVARARESVVIGAMRERALALVNNIDTNLVNVVDL